MQIRGLSGGAWAKLAATLLPKEIQVAISAQLNPKYGKLLATFVRIWWLQIMRRAADA